MKHLVKLLTVGFIVSAALAQEPKGTYRLRYSNMGNGDHMFRRGLFMSQDFAQLNGAQTVPNLFGSNPTSTLGANTSDNTGDPDQYAGWAGWTGSGNWVTTAYSDFDSFGLTGQMYIHAVAQPSVQGANITLLAKWAGGGLNRTVIFYFGQDQANSKPTCAILQGSDGQLAGTFPSDLENTVNQWDAWACVANGSTITVYKNGRPSSQPGAYDGTIYWAGQPMYTGALDQSSTYSYRGYIAHLQAGNIAPTANQVWKDYKVLRRRMLALYGIVLP